MRPLHNWKLATMSFVENGRVERSKHQVAVENRGVCLYRCSVVLHLNPNSPAMQRKHGPALAM